MNIIKSKTSPEAWNEKYNLADFVEAKTMCRHGCGFPYRMEGEAEDQLWVQVGYCIASNFADAWGGTAAPDSRVKVEFDIPAPYTEFVHYANILVIDRSVDEKPDLIINTLTGESVEY